MARLPNHGVARIDLEKLTGYVLDTAHPDGGHKARVIARVLGYDMASAPDFMNAIRRGLIAADAVPGVTDRFGTRYTVDMIVDGPSGTAQVRTGWIIDSGSLVPRLVTAFVR